MNRQNKVQHHFNVIDAILLLLFAAGLFFLLRTAKSDKLPAVDCTVDFAIRIDGVSVSEADILGIGDTLTAQDGSVIGKVTDVKREPYESKRFNYDTERFVDASSAESLTLRVYAEAPCVQANGRYRSAEGSVLLCAGESLALRLPLHADAIIVTDVAVKEDTNEEE